MIPLQRTTFTNQNLFGGAKLLGTYVRPAAAAAINAQISLLLKSVQGGGVIQVWWQRTDQQAIARNAVPESIYPASGHLGWESHGVLLMPGDTLKVYAQSFETGDTAIDGTVEFSDQTAADYRSPNRHWYVNSTGVPATDGATLKAVVEGAVAGDIVYVGPGDYDLGVDYAFVSRGVRVEGAGIEATYIYTVNNVALWTSPAAQITDLTTTSKFGVMIYNWSEPNDGLIRLRRLRLKLGAESEDMILNNLGGDMVVEDCVLESNWIGVSLNGGYGRARTVLRNCVLRSYAHAGYTPAEGRQYNALTAMNGSEIVMEGGLIDITGSGVQPVYAVVVDPTSTVHLRGVRFSTSAPEGVPHQQIVVQPGGTCVVDTKTVYDATRCSGTIIRSDDPVAKAATAVSNEDWTVPRAEALDNLDVTVGSRAPESAGNIAAIKGKTDKLPADPAAVGSPMTLEATEDIYHADIAHVADNTNGRDEYAVTWFRNNAQQSPTAPKIRVVNWADGTDLVGETSMVQVGSTATYRHTETVNRIPQRQLALVIATATIDGEFRTQQSWVGRGVA